MNLKLLSSTFVNRLIYLFVFTGVLITGFSCQKTEEKTFEELTGEEIHNPEYALLGVEMREGFDITLFASEDMVRNPTNMDVDDKGRVWITEGVNYRSSLNPNIPQIEDGDRIVILEDKYFHRSKVLREVEDELDWLKSKVPAN